MVRRTQKRSHRRALDRHGRDVTLRNYNSSSEDDYGEVWSETADSPHTVTARVDRSRAPTPDRDARQEGEVSADVEVYIKDDTTAASNLRDGGGKGATEIDVDGETYVVLRSNDQDNGLLELTCERE